MKVRDRYFDGRASGVGQESTELVGFIAYQPCSEVDVTEIRSEAALQDYLTRDKITDE